VFVRPLLNQQLQGCPLWVFPLLVRALMTAPLRVRLLRFRLLREVRCESIRCRPVRCWSSHCSPVRCRSIRSRIIRFSSMQVIMPLLARSWLAIPLQTPLTLLCRRRNPAPRRRCLKLE
jgi:hypothetical protein